MSGYSYLLWWKLGCELAASQVRRICRGCVNTQRREWWTCRRYMDEAGNDDTYDRVNLTGRIDHHFMTCCVWEHVLSIDVNLRGNATNVGVDSSYMFMITQQRDGVCSVRHSKCISRGGTSSKGLTSRGERKSRNQRDISAISKVYGSQRIGC